MIKLLLSITCFLFVLNSFSQDTIFVRHPKGWVSGSTDYTTDTTLLENFSDRLIMAGTTIIPNSHNQLNVWGTYQLKLEKVSGSDCTSQGEKAYADDFINFITETDSTLFVSTTIHDNCCYNFLCDVSVEEGGILNLIYTGYGTTYCGCNCCFGMDYYFKKEDLPTEVELKAFMINGDRKNLKVLK